MTPYCSKHLTPPAAASFNTVSRLMAALPDLDLGLTPDGQPIVLSCHMVARALAKAAGLKYVDGHYGKVYAHSWLLSPDGKWIIDPYPVGTIGGPVLVDLASGPYAPGRWLYNPSRKLGKELPFSSAPFRRSVRRLVRALRKIESRS